ncbi:hypothetical protein NX862_00510 [Rhodobacter sp. KR11]|jgi:hypothetical protein|uniref:hypothetical protein n=1 Tax=Rhodobacter sp. KR11 TaxID=2974588 RepID=UPI00222292F8|nr:hypothetical protein [Rhodobacter sp. KR11]MCW1917228.1 hypothetical protein [Rhodobacter sp. KR11]
MIRKSVLFVALAATLAAGSAFASTKVSGAVTQVDAPNGYVWLEGVRYDVGRDFATGLTAGNQIELVTITNGTAQDVVHASIAGF